jgi:hypothetical protein
VSALKAGANVDSEETSLGVSAQETVINVLRHSCVLVDTARSEQNLECLCVGFVACLADSAARYWFSVH